MYTVEYTDGNYARELLYESYELDCIFDVIHNGSYQLNMAKFPDDMSKINYKKNVYLILKKFGIDTEYDSEEDTLTIVKFNTAVDTNMRAILKEAMPYLYKEYPKIFGDVFDITLEQLIKSNDNVRYIVIMLLKLQHIGRLAIDAGVHSNAEIRIHINESLMLNTNTRRMLIAYMLKNKFKMKLYDAAKEELILSLI